MSETGEVVTWTYSKAESGALEVLYYMGMSFFIIYLLFMMGPMLAGFGLF